MIDIENDVFQAVYDPTVLEFPNLFLSSEHEDLPASLPAATLMMSDNRILERMRTDQIENAVTVMFELNVYSDKAAGKRSEAKKIFNKIDGLLTGFGFTRQTFGQIANLNNDRIFRIVARYAAVVGPDGNDRFLIYQNY